MSEVSGVVLEEDPLTRYVQTYHFDAETERIILEGKQDVTAIIERNKRLRAEGAKGKEWRLEASIPDSVYYELRKKGITRDPKAFAKWLNDPDNALFRTSGRRI